MIFRLCKCIQFLQSAFFFSSRAGKIISLDIRRFLGGSIFLDIRKYFFWENMRKSYFPKYKKFLSLRLEGSFSQNIILFFRVGDFFRKKKIWKSYLKEKFWGLRLESIRDFLILRLESSIFRNIRKTFFEKISEIFLGGNILRLEQKSAPGSPIYVTTCKSYLDEFFVFCF